VLETLEILVLPGDGVGLEIVPVVVDCLAAVDARFGLGLTLTVEPIGLARLAASTPPSTMPADLLERVRAAAGTVLGPLHTTAYPPAAEGGINVSALLRRELDLYANLRPVRGWPGVASHCPQMDLLLVRENSEGFLADRVMSQGSGELMPTPDVALAMRKITAQGSRRIAEVAFDRARRRRGKVTAVHKRNSLKLTDGLFLREVERTAAAYPEVELDDMLVDAMAAALVRTPARFDVILATNLFGDILSDEAAELAGGIGLAPALNLGAGVAVAQAVHGAAPDIAGTDRANPVGLLLSAALLLDWLGDRHERPEMKAASAALRDAVGRSLTRPETRTRDVGGTAGTRECGRALVGLVAEAAG
jgi:3-isopropylmalate dehydrogenase